MNRKCSTVRSSEVHHNDIMRLLAFFDISTEGTILRRGAMSLLPNCIVALGMLLLTMAGCEARHGHDQRRLGKGTAISSSSSKRSSKKSRESNRGMMRRGKGKNGDSNSGMMRSGKGNMRMNIFSRSMSKIDSSSPTNLPTSMPITKQPSPMIPPPTELPSSMIQSIGPSSFVPSAIPFPTDLPTPPLITLYRNDFENPNQQVEPNGLCPLLDNTAIDVVYGLPEAGFRQAFTVETVLIQSNFNSTTPYEDPDGTGGNFAIGMLSTVNNDRLGFSFNTVGNAFVNVALDISSIELPRICCRGGGGCGPVAEPVFRLSLIDDPNGSIPISGGALLDSVDISGPAGPNGWTYQWTRHSIALDASAATNGRVSLVFDLLQSKYGVFDNLVVQASDTPGTAP